MTPRQRVLNRIANSESALWVTIDLYYETLSPEIPASTIAGMKADDMKALRYLVRKAKEGR